MIGLSTYNQNFYLYKPGVEELVRQGWNNRQLEDSLLIAECDLCTIDELLVYADKFRKSEG